MHAKNRFFGRGEVRGFEFSFIGESEHGLLYKVNDDGRKYYEIFRKKLSPPEYVRFQHPRSKVFGIWAWTYKDINDARDRLVLIDLHQEIVAKWLITEGK